jgi:branched-subunit amino acid ABC-type transport system permease component
LLALAFEIASIISIAPSLTDMFGAYTKFYTSPVTPIFGYTSVGGYLVLAGIITAVAGSVLGAAHIKHPSQTK